MILCRRKTGRLLKTTNERDRVHALTVFKEKQMRGCFKSIIIVFIYKTALFVRKTTNTLQETACAYESANESVNKRFFMP